MLTELKCGKTHVQFFIEGNCIATVRIEYEAVVKEALKLALAAQTVKESGSIAKTDHTDISTEEK